MKAYLITEITPEYLISFNRYAILTEKNQATPWTSNILDLFTTDSLSLFLHADWQTTHKIPDLSTGDIFNLGLVTNQYKVVAVLDTATAYQTLTSQHPELFL